MMSDSTSSDAQLAGHLEAIVTSQDYFERQMIICRKKSKYAFDLKTEEMLHELCEVQILCYACDL